MGPSSCSSLSLMSSFRISNDEGLCYWFPVELWFGIIWIGIGHRFLFDLMFNLFEDKSKSLAVRQCASVEGFLVILEPEWKTATVTVEAGTTLIWWFWGQTLILAISL